MLCAGIFFAVSFILCFLCSLLFNISNDWQVTVTLRLFERA